MNLTPINLAIWEAYGRIKPIAYVGISYFVYLHSGMNMIYAKGKNHGFKY